MKPILVGEDNPFGGPPHHALWCEPRRSAGGRLCYNILGLASEREYIRGFDRANLCRGKWSAAEASKYASELEHSHRTLILLGAKVCHAFGYNFEPFTVKRKFTSASAEVVIGTPHDEWTFVLLPHPSGRNHLWNEPGSYWRARLLLTKVGALPVPPSPTRMPPTRREWIELHSDDHPPTIDTTTKRPAYCENCGKLAQGTWCDDCGSYDTGWRRCTVCGNSFKGVKDADPVEKLCSPECAHAYHADIE